VDAFHEVATHRASEHDLIVVIFRGFFLQQKKSAIAKLILDVEWCGARSPNEKMQTGFSIIKNRTTCSPRNSIIATMKK
jgi:hypothetical protein